MQGKNGQKNAKRGAKNTKVATWKSPHMLSKLFYGLIGFSASLAFFLALYWSLRLNASINNLIQNFIGTPLYFWPYVILTLAAIVLFGVSVVFFVYRWRKWGPPRIKKQTGTGIGSLVGIVASACPVCGSTILSAIGIAGGLTVFPLGGLELKALSLGLLALPIWLMRKDIKRLESDCKKGTCPAPQDPSLKANERHWLTGLLILIAALAYVAFSMLKTDPALARLLANNASVSKTDNTFAFTFHVKRHESSFGISSTQMKLQC